VTFEVIIPTIRACSDLLAACIEGVIETTGQKPLVVEGGTFAENCNLGAAGTAADVLIFLNDDCELLTGWLEPLLKPFEDERVGIVGAKLVYPDGRVQHAGVWFDQPNGVLTAHNHLDDFPSRNVDAVTGACMAVRATTFHDLGGFDPAFRNGYEDVDLCLRARRDGWRIWYECDSVLIHHESQSGPARWAHVRENIDLLQARWT
jgi:GT2 family glycosyltransferase